MNKRLALIPITGLSLLTLAGCGKTNTIGPSNQVISSPPSVSANSTNKITSTSPQSNYESEMKLILSKGYTVRANNPDVTVQTASGKTLSAWIGIKATGDGHNQYVFFFLDGKFLGTDTAKPSVEITSVKAVSNGITVTYPVYKKNDSFANPTGTPVTITYTWNGSKLAPNIPYPQQFN